ncbi:MAG TPA: beta-ketoacyl-[acyl-carrier-protein] synthase family protein [Chitinivibrionales bacterium]|nr:beta-ketoacyl-[acyl-carrier-protein] synthase family protein [Chitinivibrionales bacterium]
MKNDRAVVTGLGVVSPIGTGVEAFWNAACKGTNGIAPLTSFDTTGFRTSVGAEVKDFSAGSFLAPSQVSSMGRSSQFAVAASKMALADAGLDIAKHDPYRTGVSFGTTMGEPQVLEEGIERLYGATGSADALPEDLPRKYPCGVISANVASALGACGPVIMIPTACAAGNYAIGYAHDLIRRGMADVVIAGGSDPISKIAFTGFNRLLATAKECCRPFDKNRDGMAVGEGAGSLVLESLSHAKKRGAKIYAEVLGYGLGCDAFKMTIPDPSGSGGILALTTALAHANIGPDAVDYVSAHGTGTEENDRTETLIIKTVLGERAKSVPVSSLKSMIGHTMGAASAIEAAACCLTMSHGVILPTINYRTPDPECDLDYVPNAARSASINIAVSNAYAFGGNTSSLVLGRFKG